MPDPTPNPRYLRQLKLPFWDQAAQDRLTASHAMIVGCGALGCPSADLLARAGVGKITLIDRDLVETSNLHRQILFDAQSVGESKATLAAQRLAALNPFITVTTITERITRNNVVKLVADYDVLVDCTDNFETKFLLNDVAVLHKKRLIQASIYQYEGQLFVYDPKHDGPCVRCLWPEMPKPGFVGSCAEVGVLGAIAGVFGTLQAVEVLKHLLDLPDKLQGDTFFLDLLSLRSHKVKAERNATCPVCSTQATITAIEAEAPVELDATELNGNLGDYALIDIRERKEAEASPLPVTPALRCPAGDIHLDDLHIDVPEPWLLVCTRGMRSKYLALALRKAGCEKVYSLRGGAPALEQVK
ncbi:MAG: HesA/MoeB/ThiF family protein [Candidatus Hydrogenedentes bacterium]|nr:HesA/MoeB/ThiF family protein [Candidatus Hydrogenedentota bacterium]